MIVDYVDLLYWDSIIVIILTIRITMVIPVFIAIIMATIVITIIVEAGDRRHRIHFHAPTFWRLGWVQVRTK